MDILSKTIKKLSDEEYQNLLYEVSGKKKNKPYMVLEATRNSNIDDSDLMDMLQVNASAYYTLKSRLNSKIANILSKKVENPIQTLMDEVSRVPAHLFGNNRDFSIRALRELEKQLVEYDLNAELILVYKTLAQLHVFSEDYDYFENKYKRHVAFSLAVSKAENIFFKMLKKIGEYQLNQSETELEEIVLMKRELSNICELYDSHRLFVLYNIAKVYYLCSLPSNIDGLASREIEIDTTLQKMNEVFEKYPLDTFYQNIKGITNLLYFEYYSKTKNVVRADYYLNKVHAILPELAEKPTMHFFLIQFLHSKINKYTLDANLEQLAYGYDLIEGHLDIKENETYHMVSAYRYLATVRFYSKDFQGAAKKINQLRNKIGLKQHLVADVDNKIFQALQYCILGEDSLCMQIISSLKRQIKDNESQFESTKTMIKILKAALKPADYRKKMKKIAEMWTEFEEGNKSSFYVMKNIKLDETTLRKMCNPIKS
ncbi:MAG: hypothetical protein ACKOX3_11870 [Bacteroidota bacterium]